MTEAKLGGLDKDLLTTDEAAQFAGLGSRQALAPYLTAYQKVSGIQFETNDRGGYAIPLAAARVFRRARERKLTVDEAVQVAMNESLDAQTPNEVLIAELKAFVSSGNVVLLGLQTSSSALQKALEVYGVELGEGESVLSEVVRESEKRVIQEFTDARSGLSGRIGSAADTAVGKVSDEAMQAVQQALWRCAPWVLGFAVVLVLVVALIIVPFLNSFPGVRAWMHYGIDAPAVLREARQPAAPGR